MKDREIRRPPPGVIIPVEAQAGLPVNGRCRAEATMSDRSHATGRDRASQPQPSRLARIAKRAHEIYDARGGQDGKDLDDWLQAEREIDAEMEGGGTGDSR
jgi:hypothetical protein